MFLDVVVFAINNVFTSAGSDYSFVRFPQRCIKGQIHATEAKSVHGKKAVKRPFLKS